MSTQQAKLPSYLRRLPPLLRRRRIRGWIQHRPQVAVAKSVEDKLRPRHRSKQVRIPSRPWLQGTYPFTVQFGGVAEGLGQLAQRFVGMHTCQGIEVTFISGLADAGSAFDVGDSLAQGEPLPRTARMAFRPTKSLKSETSLRVVSTHKTVPCLSYILIQLAFRRCLTRRWSARRDTSLTTSPWNFPWTPPCTGNLRPRNRITSTLEKVWAACRRRCG
jgi:hypothetical protein